MSCTEEIDIFEDCFTTSDIDVYASPSKESCSSDSVICVYELSCDRSCELRYLEEDSSDEQDKVLLSSSSSIVFMYDISSAEKNIQEPRYLEDDEEEKEQVYMKRCLINNAESEDDEPTIRVVIDEDIPWSE